MENAKEHSFKYNLAFAFLAQGGSMLLSLAIYFILPKFLDVPSFSYWQLFSFYTTYVGCTQLGLTDGIYLSIGGKKYSELDRQSICVQFWALSIWDALLFIAVIVLSFSLGLDANRRFVLIAAGVYMLVYNLSRYLGFIFQAVNHTNIFSKTTIIDRIIVLFVGTLTILFGFISWQLCIVVYILGILLSLIYTVYKGRQLVFAKVEKENILPSLCEIKTNIYSGFNLMLANVASTLIVGIVRFVVDARWGLNAFGVFSFAIAITNFFLTFMNQVSLVMFPALRRVEDKIKIQLFSDIRKVLSVLLSIIYIAYIPIKLLLGMWLPQYSQSLDYLFYLLPLCIFDGKMQLLCNTYLKVLRKERFLLYINICTAVTSLVGAIIGSYVFNNIFACIVSLLISIILRSVVSEIYISKLINIKCAKSVCIDLSMVAIFIVSGIVIKNFLINEIVLLGAYALLLVSNKKILIRIKNKIRDK